MHREYVSWESPSLGRSMELLRFGRTGRPMIWFPTSCGRFYQYEDFGLVHVVDDLIEAGAIQVICVDSVDEESLYAPRPPADRLVRQDQFDHYIMDEVVPWARKVGQTAAKVATFGASFGAYHALNFGLRHPDVVDKVVGFSGKYDIHGFLDGYWDDLAYFHCPTANVPNMGPDWVAKLCQMDLAIVTGEDDNVLEGSKQMIRVLQDKRIPHRGHIWASPYGHDWPWWRAQVRHYI